MINKVAIVFFVTIPLNTFAGDVPLENIWYHKFESAYIHNDTETVERWLSSRVKHVETVHVPGKKDISKTMTKKEILSFLKKNDDKYSVPESNYLDISIESFGNMKFCAKRTVMIEAPLDGIFKKARLVRKVCFADVKVIEHLIDIYFNESKAFI